MWPVDGCINTNRCFTAFGCSHKIAHKICNHAIKLLSDNLVYLEKVKRKAKRQRSHPVSARGTRTNSFVFSKTKDFTWILCDQEVINNNQHSKKVNNNHES